MNWSHDANILIVDGKKMSQTPQQSDFNQSGFMSQYVAWHKGVADFVPCEPFLFKDKDVLVNFMVELLQVLLNLLILTILLR